MSLVESVSIAPPEAVTVARAVTASGTGQVVAGARVPEIVKTTECAPPAGIATRRSIAPVPAAAGHVAPPVAAQVQVTPVRCSDNSLRTRPVAGSGPPLVTARR